MGKNLTLTGMMGVGKTTIGRNLAKKLNYKFIDVDKLIEIKEGQTIGSIFKSKGENYFRKIENATVLSELKRSNAVISLGGGAFINNSIRRNTKKMSVSFWLDVPLEILVQRLKKNNLRPLLDKKNINETIKKIYFERKKIYNEANYRIKCNSLKTEEIVKKILGLYEKSTN